MDSSTARIEVRLSSLISLLRSADSFLFFTFWRLPKQNVVVKQCNELKCIYDMSGNVNDFEISADYYYLQPCDTGDATQNHLIIQQCIDYIKRHPRWRLSLQTHKLVGFK